MEEMEMEEVEVIELEVAIVRKRLDENPRSGERV